MTPIHSTVGFVILASGLPFLGACAPKAPVASPTVPSQTAYSAPAIVPSQPLTSAELAQARQQLASCWYLDPHKTLAPIPTVEIKVELLPDGTVTSAQLVNPGRVQTDPAFRDAVEAARRAILKCSPLKLPPDKYLYWKSTVFRFSPSGTG
jgi:hypothetical protein